MIFEHFSIDFIEFFIECYSGLQRGYEIMHKVCFIPLLANALPQSSKVFLHIANVESTDIVL